MTKQVANAVIRRAFTLVELLTVIAIIGVLVALLLPAVQAARESARRAQCMNHLKQLSLAFLNFEQSTRAFPSGGWGDVWLGVPHRGLGPGQPGAWAYQILPFMEEQSLFDLGTGLTGQAEKDAYRNRLKTPLAVHYCPTRRATALYPYHWDHPVLPFGYGFIGARNPVAKNDYAVNIGDPAWTCCHDRPLSFDVIDNGTYTYPDLFDHTGISFAFSNVRVEQVTDGLSHTYMLGEKYLNPDMYTTGSTYGDDQTLYHGHNSDLMRSTNPMFGPPRQDQPGLDLFEPFGSAHSTGCNFAMCDGSVRTISYDSDPEMHRRLGHRADGFAVPETW
jgi:prepilin-type N-terminal cleavage/methylation domain-containing protein/prepilin-type processing-associated H-X9-DG protein